MVLSTLLLLPGVALVRGFRMPTDIALTDTPLQLAVAAGVVAAALGMAVVQRRLAAVLLLGAVGYGIAILFMIQGAPDLALTQLLVETLALGIFVIVLRRLPDRFAQPAWRLSRGLRAALSIGVGLFVGALALYASTARTEGTNAEEFLARALPDGGGRNVVNVILTDFRALDTLGEITVLVVVAVGVMSLVRGVISRERQTQDEGAAARHPEEDQ
jgi:multicomponent Na+:H+ antiporter subunit A